ncbi:uncharacterized protein LOC131926997 isoform X5 [Physella acuta]|uniref:uncharacterized protein LOC131926997 isoform X5 n=1 Tax=Physella acuta TaxID=109671 RepID=UPI0027DE7748|nr:uncharacterized protein LOC131926997 isoform X5 [Physella acuta]
MLLTLSLVLMVPALCLGFDDPAPWLQTTEEPPSEPDHSFCNTSKVYLFPWSDVRVRSPVGEDGNYVDNLSCQLRFRTLDGPLLVTISFQDFDLEQGYVCRYDFLCINGVKFCGTSPKDQEYQFLVPEYENFTLTFVTDGSVTRRGFQLSLQARMYTGGIVSTPTGVVNNSSSKNFANVTLGSVYTDGCVTTPNPLLQGATTTSNPWNPTSTSPSYPTTSSWYPTTSNPCYGHPCATHPCNPYNPNNPNNPNNPRNPYSIYAVMEAVQYLQQEQFNRDHVLSLLQLFLQHNRM